MDWDLEQALRRVHKSNMSKLGDDGKPVKRKDGKVLKGPNYKPPDLSDLV
jgi:predicted HAD superfamily Cof-like phosphohydrolase